MEIFDQPKEVFFYGSTIPLPSKINLKAGPINLIYESGLIKYLKAGNSEILRMIYSAVRDANWGTIPAQIEEEQIKIEEQAFVIKYKAVYKQDDIHFEANYIIEGNPKGKIRFLMKGKSFSNFKKNRIGFCVLHPAAIAGYEVKVTHTDTSMETGVFPELVSPHQPFRDIKAMQWKPADHLIANLTFNGDIFEMEDQRNWIDDSFKTYCTPLNIPFPVEMEKGDIVEQEVVLQIYSNNVVSHESENDEIKFMINQKEYFSMPSIGIGRSSQVKRLTEQEMECLEKIRFSHLRVDLRLNNAGDWQKVYHDALAEAMNMGYLLELSLFFGSDAANQAKQLVELIDPAQIKYVNIYSTDDKVIPDHLLQKIVPLLKKYWKKVKIGAGTDAFFTELNRQRIINEDLDFLCYSINPLFHHFDNDSYVETAAASRYGVQTSMFFSNKPIHVTPYTLKMRWNPNATEIENEIPANGMPAKVDPRQMSMLNAGVTLATLKYIAQEGVESTTWFETVGERGIMMGNRSSRYEKFIAEPFTFYPVFFMFKEILTGDDWQVVKSESTDRLKVDGICIRKNGDMKVLLANLTGEKQEVTIARKPSLKVLISYYDHLNAPKYYKDPNYKVVAETKLTDQALKIELLPYAFVVVEYLFN